MKVLLRARIFGPPRASSVLGSSTCCQARLRSSSLRLPAWTYSFDLILRTFMDLTPSVRTAGMAESSSTSRPRSCRNGSRQSPH